MGVWNCPAATALAALSLSVGFMYMEALRMEIAEALLKGRKALLRGCYKLGDLRLDEHVLHTLCWVLEE